MTQEEKILLYKDTLQIYGETHQKNMAIEECAELIQAINKELRGKRNLCPLIKEIADVEIMLEQLKIIYNVDPIMFEKAKQGKLERHKADIDIIKSNSVNGFPF